MRVYVDSSALIKRAVEESESDATERALARHDEAGDVLVSSSLAWVEVSRGIRSRIDHEPPSAVTGLADEALSGIREIPISASVVALARRLDPPVLRSLDALHLGTAILLDVGLLIAFDEHLLMAAEEHGIPVASPG